MYSWDSYEALALDQRLRLEELERRRQTLRHLGARVSARTRNHRLPHDPA